jgi:hypothetical protein
MMGDEFNPGTAPFFFALVPGSVLGLELLEELVGLGGGVLVLDVDEAAMSPAPPLPPAVRGTGVGLLVSSSELYHGPSLSNVVTDLRFQLYCFMRG